MPPISKSPFSCIFNSAESGNAENSANPVTIAKTMFMIAILRLI